MKIYCISDTVETAVGLKLSGIETKVIQEKQEAQNEIEEILKNANIGILIITENIYQLCQKKFDDIKENKKLPLLVKI